VQRLVLCEVVQHPWGHYLVVGQLSQAAIVGHGYTCKPFQEPFLHEGKPLQMCGQRHARYRSKASCFISNVDRKESENIFGKVFLQDFDVEPVGLGSGEVVKKGADRVAAALRLSVEVRLRETLNGAQGAGSSVFQPPQVIPDSLRVTGERLQPQGFARERHALKYSFRANV
jgi:hypothetical protein